jgi:hypothetical protein
MVGWLKHFIHSRPKPAESLVKGYTIHMLARRAPTLIVVEYNARWDMNGTDLSDRGHLIYISTLMARKAGQPGNGRIVVSITRRNSKVIEYDNLPQAFTHRMTQYNAACKSANQRFLQDNDRIQYLDILEGQPIHTRHRGVH